MNFERTLLLWRRSEQELKLRYATLISDGDAKTHVKRTHMTRWQSKTTTVWAMCKSRWGLICRRRRKVFMLKKEGDWLKRNGHLTEAVMDRTQIYYNAVRKLYET